MRLPQGSASSMLSLAAGGIVAAVIATAWMPMLQSSGAREIQAQGERLTLVARLARDGLGLHIPGVDPSLSTPAARAPVEAALARTRELAQLDRALLVSPTGNLLASAPSSHPSHYGAPLGDRVQIGCDLGLVASAGEQFILDPSDPSGLASQSGCVAVTDGGGQLIGVVVAMATADYLQAIERDRTRTTALLLGLGALAGLVVIFGVRWLLSPVHEISEYAASIASGTRGVRVEPRGPEEIAQLARAVNALASNFEAREDEIKSRMAVVTKLSSMVAHEVRNPLQSLSLLTTLARTESNPEVRTNLLLKVEEEIHVLEDVVQRFLRGSGPLQISRDATDLVEVISRAAAVAEPEARKRKVSLLIQAPGRLEAHVDGSLLRRALENLVLNAIEFAGKTRGGQVTMSLLPGGRQILLLVDDDGPGVPAHLRERIFQPYYSSKSGGTGLGLALCKEVIEAHGGTLRCEDSPLGGARFTATIPIVAEERTP